MKLSKNTEVDITTLCDFLDLTPGRITQLLQEHENVIAKAAANRYRLRNSCRGYIAYLRSENRPGAASTELIQERTRALQLKNDLLEHKTMYVEESLFVLDEIIGALVSRLDGVPAAFTRDLSERARLKAILDGIRTEVGALFGKRAAEIKATGAALLPEDEDDAE